MPVSLPSTSTSWSNRGPAPGWVLRQRLLERARQQIALRTVIGDDAQPPVAIAGFVDELVIRCGNIGRQALYDEEPAWLDLGFPLESPSLPDTFREIHLHRGEDRLEALEIRAGLAHALYPSCEAVGE